MPDWTRSMQQTFEFYTVDPITWRDVAPLDNIRSCSITRDETTDTLETATIDCDLVFAEQYVRIYLITVQDGIRERFPMGTFLVQTPSETFDGKVKSTTLDAYSPLLEWKDSMPPLGYAIKSGLNVLETAWLVGSDNTRTPIVKNGADTNLTSNFIAETDDSWLTFLGDLVMSAGYKLALDEYSRIMFAPIQDTASLKPIWTYNDDNSSILYPDLTVERDLYGIPNVLEVILSNDTVNLFSRVENNDEDSPVSIPSRGRQVVVRESNPEIAGIPTQAQLDAYTEQRLRNMSSLEYKLTYKHGYCPVRVGDCVYLNYKRAGMRNIKAKVVSQNITCEPGCPVEETAVYTLNMWAREGGLV